MRTRLRERQFECEKAGRVLAITHQEFLEAGFYRVLQPRRFSGYEFSPTDFVRLLLEISRGCLDSGWVLSIIASQPTFLSSLPEQAQREAYGASGDCRTVSVIKPAGAAIPVTGGFRIHGTWDYCSGCDIATHVQAMVLLRDATNQPPKGVAFVLLDREQCEIIDNWNMMGMQGTGSRRIVVAEHFVPAHRVLPITGDCWETSKKSEDTHCPNPLVGGFAAYSVAVGAARGALDVYEEDLRHKKWIMPPFPPRYEMPELQQSFGEAQALIDTAEAALLSLVDQYSKRWQAACETGSPIPGVDARRMHRAGVQCIELSWQAVDLMFRTAGTSSASLESPLGRYFRGLAVLRTHVGLQRDHISMDVARLHFGLPTQSPL